MSIVVNGLGPVSEPNRKNKKCAVFKSIKLQNCSPTRLLLYNRCSCISEVLLQYVICFHQEHFKSLPCQPYTWHSNGSECKTSPLCLAKALECLEAMSQNMHLSCEICDLRFWLTSNTYSSILTSTDLWWLRRGFIFLVAWYCKSNLIYYSLLVTLLILIIMFYVPYQFYLLLYISYLLVFFI